MRNENVDDEQVLDQLLGRAEALAVPGERRLLGIVGPPGGGKSTTAAWLVEQLSPSACLVPMDGFHLANADLEQLGRRHRKGAPDTFDAAGYVALLRRLRSKDETVYAPAFDRDLDEPVSAAVAVPPGIPLVVTEGNYLLLDHGPWAAVRLLLDEVWYVETDEPTRVERLARRHELHGMTPAAARAWALGSDQRNAELVFPTRDRADHVVRLGAVNLGDPRHPAPHQHRRSS